VSAGTLEVQSKSGDIHELVFPTWPGAGGLGTVLCRRQSEDSVDGRLRAEFDVANEESWQR
jgi:hypothetical protein